MWCGRPSCSPLPVSERVAWPPPLLLFRWLLVPVPCPPSGRLQVTRAFPCSQPGHGCLLVCKALCKVALLLLLGNRSRKRVMNCRSKDQMVLMLTHVVDSLWRCGLSIAARKCPALVQRGTAPSPADPAHGAGHRMSPVLSFSSVKCRFKETCED